MKKVLVVIAVLMFLAGGSYVCIKIIRGEWGKINVSNPFKGKDQKKDIVTSSPSGSQDRLAEVTVEGCEQFSAYFGMNAKEFVTSLNMVPETSGVIRGFRYINGEVVSVKPGSNLPLSIEVNCRGQITSFKCERSPVVTSSAQDFQFTIPEADFKQLILGWASLTDGKATVFLRNFDTDPLEAKETILQRIGNLK